MPILAGQSFFDEVEDRARRARVRRGFQMAYARLFRNCCAPAACQRRGWNSAWPSDNQPHGPSELKLSQRMVGSRSTLSSWKEDLKESLARSGRMRKTKPSRYEDLSRRVGSLRAWDRSGKAPCIFLQVSMRLRPCGT